MGASRLVNRNVIARRGRTSMRLEPELWSALAEICHRQGISMAELVQHIEAIGHPGGRTSAVRVHALTYFRQAATEDGHRAAQHGTPATLPPQRQPAQSSPEPATAITSGPV